MYKNRVQRSVEMRYNIVTVKDNPNQKQGGNNMDKEKMINIGLLIFTVLYVVSPDLLPGPIDDLLLIMFTYKRNKRMEQK